MIYLTREGDNVNNISTVHMTGLGWFVQQRVTLYNSTVLRGCVTVLLFFPPPLLRVGLHLPVESAGPPGCSWG